MEKFKPSYDFVADPQGRVDPAVVDEVIREAESYTRQAAPADSWPVKIGKLTARLLTGAGKHGEFEIPSLP